MVLKNIFLDKKAGKRDVVFSLEIFPPKQGLPIDTIFSTIEKLSSLRPDFVSVTYGAGGSNSKATIDIVSKLQNTYDIEALAHFTCVNASRSSIDEVLNKLSDANVKNVLALRGDPPATVNDFSWSEQEYCYAGDLVRHIKERGGFSVAAAAYPEGHIECRDLDKDVDNLAKKVNEGVDFLITQLFFDNDVYYRFAEKLARKGIDCPVTIGIMPVLNAKQINRVVALCGASIPLSLSTIIAKYENCPDDMEKAGIEYAAQQIEDLLKNDVDGVHLYTMNKAEQIRKIVEYVGLRKL